MEKAELKALTLEQAEAELSNRVYAAALFIEELEGAGKVFGNGHHAAQQVAQAAVNNLRHRWRKDKVRA
jgi:hypothetical protein